MNVKRTNLKIRRIKTSNLQIDKSRMGIFSLISLVLSNRQILPPSL